MKIWITIPTWNRKKTAETIIPITYKHKKDHFLHITDDYSTEYNAFELFKNHADQIERPPKKLGVQLLRCWEFRKFSCFSMFKKVFFSIFLLCIFFKMRTFK